METAQLPHEIAAIYEIPALRPEPQGLWLMHEEDGSLETAPECDHDRFF
jgi:hypothetical protein